MDETHAGTYAANLITQAYNKYATQAKQRSIETDIQRNTWAHAQGKHTQAELVTQAYDRTYGTIVNNDITTRASLERTYKGTHIKQRGPHSVLKPALFVI